MEATLISTVTGVFTAALGWVESVGTAVVGNELLLTFASIPLVGLGVGLFKRLINVN